MKKLRLLIVVFSLALSVPLGYFVLKTYRGLEQEEAATLSYFAETLFDEMERGLAALVQQEESRAVDEYNYHVLPSDRQNDEDRPRLSPLSQPSGEPYLLGYFQNNPDGSFQTPLVESGRQIPPDRATLVGELKAANEIFNRIRVAGTDRLKARPAEVATVQKSELKEGFADKYLDLSRTQRTRNFLGQKEKRVETITSSQAANIAKQEPSLSMSEAPAAFDSMAAEEERQLEGNRAADKDVTLQKGQSTEPYRMAAEGAPKPASPAPVAEASDYRVEVPAYHDRQPDLSPGIRTEGESVFKPLGPKLLPHPAHGAVCRPALERHGSGPKSTDPGNRRYFQ